MTNQPRILIVDDEPFNVAYLEQELEYHNCVTLAAINGQDALDKIKSEHPDLVLLDVMMPIMDGFAVLERIKADPLTRDIPVVVISASNDLESVVRGIKMGAEDYLPKPFEPTLLHARIAASLEKKSLRDQQRKLLHTFASEAVAEQLMANGFSLGGKSMDATIMFTDIRSFSSYTEKYGAADIIEMLNDYFAAMFEPISRHMGVVNQIIGDGLMALFGTISANENHREQAVLAALEMLDVLEGFNQKRIAASKPCIKIGIGIASGTVMAGYAGTQHRATYTCFGDAVNLAARIETYTKTVGKSILIDSVTCEGLPNTIKTESLGSVMFKGKSIPIDIHSVVLEQG